MRAVLTSVCLLFCLALAAPAADLTALEPTGYVNDFARVIDPSTRSALEQYCAGVERATGAQIAVVTVDTLAGEPVEDAANALYRRWGIGKKGSDEGALLLLVIQDRKMRLEIGYGLEPIIPDGFAGGVLRTMRPALRESQYGEAAMEAVRTLGSRIAESKGVTIDTALPRRNRRSTPPLNWPVLLLGGFFLLWAMGAAAGRRRGGGRWSGGSGTGMLTGMIIGNLLGRSLGGQRGGGGFGGFDSGDSFGGFGGGSSGGGGASSSW
ncbi:MAG: TPM domain-containing protein [Bryobacterales bacterium]|nr:TPM domain-containing protein [Bryobacterales bacterium]